MAVVVQNAAPVGRVRRNPRHSFHIRQKPFAIQPFMIAPVIPGETMKSLLLQSRVVTSPIKNALIGWWQEYYFFYVKHRDLAGRDDFTEMMLDLDKDLTAYDAGANALPYYEATGSRKWVSLCVERIVETYFRADDEGTGPTFASGLSVSKVNMDGVANSFTLDDDFIPPADVDLVVGVDDKITASELDQTMRMWQFQRANNLTDMTYEDWLATYGISTPQVELNTPELIRYVREWQYPSNTVDPSTGVPSSAVSWAIQQRADKDRFFREPGFIIGLTVTRPKVYFGNQLENVSSELRSALDWLPAMMRDDPWTSVRKFAETAGPFQVISDANGYWLDLKDLFIHGDQFVNFDRSATDWGAVALPTATGNVLYPSETDVDALFAGTAKTVNQDGIVQLEILGALTDTTPNLRRG